MAADIRGEETIQLPRILIDFDHEFAGRRQTNRRQLNR
jgi:hypothetical protein